MEFEKIIKLVEAVSASGLTAFEMEENGMRILMQSAPVPAKAAVTSPAGDLLMAEPKTVSAERAVMSVEKADRGPGALEAQPGVSDVFSEEQIVKAPLVGTFYAAPSEEAEPFVKIGDRVKKGQALGIIEAMKLMNEIESEYDGIVEAVLISNEQVVEYGQPLFRIRRKG